MTCHRLLFLVIALLKHYTTASYLRLFLLFECPFVWTERKKINLYHIHLELLSVMFPSCLGLSTRHSWQLFFRWPRHIRIERQFFKKFGQAHTWAYNSVFNLLKCSFKNLLFFLGGGGYVENRAIAIRLVRRHTQKWKQSFYSSFFLMCVS